MKNGADEQLLPLTTTIPARTLPPALLRSSHSPSWIYTTAQCCQMSASTLESFARLRDIYIQNHTTNNHTRKTRLKAGIYFVEFKGYNIKLISARRISVLLELKNVSNCCLTCNAFEMECEDPVHVHSITTNTITVFTL